MLSAIMEGGGGIAVTELEVAVDDNDTTLSVTSTDMFLDADVVVMGDEKVLYTGTTGTTFTGCSRGYDGTDAVSHADGDNVYTPEASALNTALGFNIAATSVSVGLLSVVVIPYKFFTMTIPHLINMNYSFLQGNLAIIGYFFFAAAAGLVITLAIQLISVAQGIIR